MNIIKKILCGLIPLPFGVVMSILIKHNLQLPLFFINAIALVIWSAASFVCTGKDDNILSASFLISIPAFAMLLLSVFQELVTGDYFPGIIGLAPHVFYIPYLYISSHIVHAGSGVEIVRPCISYAISFFILFILSLNTCARAKARYKSLEENGENA